MVRFVHDAYALPAASDAQVSRIEASCGPWNWTGPSGSRPNTATPPPNHPRTGPPTGTQLPAYRCAPDAPEEPDGSKDDDERIRHPPPPSEDGSPDGSLTIEQSSAAGTPAF